VLAVLAWQTISDEKMRLVTLIVLAGFAVRTLAHRRDGIREGTEGDSKNEPT
jgi:hypothetical protein